MKKDIGKRLAEWAEETARDAAAALKSRGFWYGAATLGSLMALHWMFMSKILPSDSVLRVYGMASCPAPSDRTILAVFGLTAAFLLLSVFSVGECVNYLEVSKRSKDAARRHLKAWLVSGCAGLAVGGVLLYLAAC